MEVNVRKIKGVHDRRLINYEINLWLDAKEYRKLIRECGNIPMATKMMIGKIGGEIFRKANVMKCPKCGNVPPHSYVKSKTCIYCGGKLKKVISMRIFNLSIEKIYNGFIVRGSVEPCLTQEIPKFFEKHIDALNYVRRIIDRKEEEYDRHMKIMEGK